MCVIEGSGYEIGAGMVLGLVAFTVPVPVLIGMVRQMERDRLAGRGDSVPPSVLIEGGAAALSPKRQGWAKWMGYAFVVTAIVHAIVIRKSVLAFGLGVFFAILGGWRLLAGRRRA